MLIKILVLMILLTLSTSCRRQDPNGYPKLHIIEQLSPAFSYIEIDGKRYIDVEDSRCNSRLYQVSRDYIGPVNGRGDNVDEGFIDVILPIEECDRVVGYSPIEYGTFTTWLESMRQWLLSWL